MSYTITGQVLGILYFPDHPNEVGASGLYGGEDVVAERTTFRSTSEAARWCERIMRGDATPRRWAAIEAGARLDLVKPGASPSWSVARVVVTDDYDHDDTVSTYHLTEEGWKPEHE